MKRPRPAPPGRAKVLSHSRAVWSGYAILLALGSWLYFGALVGHGVEVDDEIYIQHSGILSGDLSALWSPDWLYPGRPTVLLLFAFVHCLSGTAPASYHILTILCHTLAAFLLARVCCRLGGSLEIGLLGGVLFLVNVAHFRAVHWISASAYPLALLFSLVAILFYLQFEERKNTVWLAGTYGSFLVAVLAHVSAVAVLPFCLFTSWLNNRDVRFAAVRLLPLSLLLAGVVASLVWLYPHTVQVYHSAHLPDLPLALRHYFWLWSRLVTTAHWMLVPLWEYREWEPVVGLLAFGVAAALVSRRTSFVTVWGVWIALTTLPFANLFLRSLAADGAGPSRHLYMASAGSSLVLAWLLSQGRQWLRKRSYWPWCRCLHRRRRCPPGKQLQCFTARGGDRVLQRGQIPDQETRHRPGR